jgi:hypothetical protein
MQTRRWIVSGASIAISAAFTAMIIFTNLQLLPQIPLGLGLSIGPLYTGFGTTLQKFSYSNTALVFISVACIVGIWLDYFLDAKILKS